ncbi:MAG: MFS transporter, partial [Ignavibacteria bacterium]|nr:MFS transporter [Ignavibacteria bacterium]
AGVVSLASGFGPASPVERVSLRWREFLIAARQTVLKKPVWSGLIVAAIGGAGFEAVGAIAGPFMIDHGLTTAQVGFFFSFPAIGGMIFGALAGGFASDRLGRRRSVALFLVLLALSILALAGAGYFSPGLQGDFLLVLLTAVYCCIGLFTASSYAFFMDLTDPRLGATQFSAFMGVTNLCESWSGFTIGRMIPLIGYPAGIAIMGIVSLIALPFVFLSRDRPENQKAAS